jgi:hypothetical protein
VREEPLFLQNSLYVQLVTLNNVHNVAFYNARNVASMTYAQSTLSDAVPKPLSAQLISDPLLLQAHAVAEAVVAKVVEGMSGCAESTGGGGSGWRSHACQGRPNSAAVGLRSMGGSEQAADLSGHAAALAAGRIEAEIEIRAQAVRYVPERDAVEIITNHNAGFLIPRQWIGALQDVPTKELSKLEVCPDGSAIELEDRDIQISVHGLLTAILPAMLPSRSVAAIFASRGGQATSRAKR